MSKLTNDKVLKIAKQAGFILNHASEDHLNGTEPLQKLTKFAELLLANTDNHAIESGRAEYASGDPVGFWLVKCMGDWNLLHSEKEADYWVEQYKIDGGEPEVIKLYLAPPNYEALQAENKELVAYARQLRTGVVKLDILDLYHNHNECLALIEEALAIPLPAALKGE